MDITWKKLKELIIKRKGLGTIGLSDISGTIISSIFWFYLASVIKPEEYGEIFYFIAIISLAFNLSTVGTLNTNIVFSAKEKKLESTLSTISLLIGAISSLILLIIFYKLDIIILLFAYVINTLSLGYLIGKKFYSKYAIYLITQKVLTVILGISFYYLFGADGIITALGISYVGFLIIIIQTYKQSPINFKEFKINFPFIWQNYSIKIIGVFKENIDKIIIVPLIGFSYLGNYALALQFVALLSMSNLFFGKYLLTHDSRNIENKTLKKYFILINICTGISASILLPIVVPYFFPQFIEIGILSIMSLVVIPTSIISVKTSELLGNEKSRPNVIGALISTSIILPGMLIAVPQYGIFGAATVFLISSIGQAVYLSIYVKKWRKTSS